MQILNLFVFMPLSLFFPLSPYLLDMLDILSLLQQLSNT